MLVAVALTLLTLFAIAAGAFVLYVEKRWNEEIEERR